MSQSIPGFAVYKLTGKAAQAASTLSAAEKIAAKDYFGGRTPPIGTAASNLARREIVDRVKAAYPEQYALLGLDRRAVTIEQPKGGYPRAYAEAPHLGMASDGTYISYYLFCPTDYKGAHYAPPLGTHVGADDLKITDFGEVVHKKDGFIGGLIMLQNRAGVAAPADFQPALHDHRAEGIQGYHYKVFIAGGSSLACVNDYLARKHTLEKARRDVVAEVERLTPEIGPGKILGAATGAVSARCWIDAAADGKPEVWVSCESGGKAAALKDNDLFTLEDFRNGAYRIAPNRNTMAGQKLGRVFDGLVSEPDLGQYWQLWNPTAPKDVKGAFHSASREGAKVPRLETIRGVHYLVYLVADDAPKDHCKAPGGIPVATAEYLWLKADVRDEDEIIRPPEPPPELSHMRPVKAEKPRPVVKP